MPLTTGETSAAECVGMPKEEIDTPALLIDLDCLEANIRVVSDYYSRKKGAALRPHQKGHRLPMIAKMQLDSGAKGVSMTSFSLAEFYADHGIDDMLITSEVLGRNKILRLANLSKRAAVTVGVDDIENARQLSKAALSVGAKVNVSVELYMERGSCGVPFEGALGLVKGLAELEGICFKGLWWHDGSTAGIADWNERRKAEFKTLDRVSRLKSQIEGAGIDVLTLSGGQTCTWNITPEYEGLQEVGVQAGAYVFSDWVEKLLPGQEVFNCALTVLTRCISRPGPNEAMFDSGMNSCSDEAGGSLMGGYRNVVGPKFKDLEGAETLTQREEVMSATFTIGARPPRIGDACELIPPHSDTTAKLHDRYYGIRNGKVEAVFPNYGRGLL